MSAYQRGIEAAKDAVIVTVDREIEVELAGEEKSVWPEDDAKRIVDAFLAKQPEVWWCVEHKRNGRGGVERLYCEFALKNDRPDVAPCRMVRARIVVQP